MGVPQVVGFAELIDMLGVSKTRVAQLLGSPDFPSPVAQLRMGKVWSYADVAAWCKKHGRQVHEIRASRGR